MDKRKYIQDILKTNNDIIKLKVNDPNDYFRLQFNRFKMKNQIDFLLKKSKMIEVS